MRNVLLAAVLSLAAFPACSKSEPTSTESAAEANLPAMTVDEVDRDVTANAATAVDCNNDKTRKKAGVVPGAILVSDHANYAATELPPDKATKLVFYCANTS